MDLRKTLLHQTVISYYKNNFSHTQPEGFIMIKKLLIGSMCALVLCTATAAAHTLPCRPPIPIEKFLELPSGPSFIGRGLNSQEEIVQVFAGQVSNSWTITISKPTTNGLDIVMCVLTAGTDWSSVPLGNALTRPPDQEL